MARVNVEAARALYPSCTMNADDWFKFFMTPAGEVAMGRVIYDIWDELHTQLEKDAGLKRIGRRPQRSAVPLDEVLRVIFPQEFSTEPLHIQIRPFVKNQRAFAKRIQLAQPHVSQLMNNSYPHLSIELMERIAKVCELRPWVFPEWRAAYIGQLFTEMMSGAPHLSIRVIKEMRTRRAKWEGVEL